MAIGRTNCGAGGSIGGLPQFTYTGDYTLLDDGNRNWRSKFLTSGTLTVEKQIIVDVFLVGAGGSSMGYSSGSSYTYIGGAGGGYTKTVKNVVLQPGDYEIKIGAPDVSGTDFRLTGEAGGTTEAFGVAALGGKNAKSHAQTTTGGWAGGSGGGGSNGLGGTDGDNGGGTNGGVGQGTTTREFEEPDGTLYATGGNGTKSSGNHGVSGAANTGDGASPNNSIKAGGSGIVVIRNARG